jgi:hypothetical protein
MTSNFYFLTENQVFILKNESLDLFVSNMVFCILIGDRRKENRRKYGTIFTFLPFFFPPVSFYLHPNIV